MSPIAVTPIEVGLTDVMVGGDSASVQRARPILEAFAGRIVETGAPEDLRKQSGLYARLATLQFDI